MAAITVWTSARSFTPPRSPCWSSRASGRNQELDRVAVEAGLDQARDLLRLRLRLGLELVVDVQREAGPLDLQAPAAQRRQHAEAFAVVLPVLQVVEQPVTLSLGDEHDVELSVPGLAVMREVQVGSYVAQVDRLEQQIAPRNVPAVQRGRDFERLAACRCFSQAT